MVMICFALVPKHHLRNLYPILAILCRIPPKGISVRLASLTVALTLLQTLGFVR